MHICDYDEEKKEKIGSPFLDTVGPQGIPRYKPPQRRDALVSLKDSFPDPLFLSCQQCSYCTKKEEITYDMRLFRRSLN